MGRVITGRRLSLPENPLWLILLQPMWHLLSHCLHSANDWKPISFWSHFLDISCGNS